MTVWVARNTIPREILLAYLMKLIGIEKGSSLIVPLERYRHNRKSKYFFGKFNNPPD